MTDADLVAAHIAAHGVTVCPLGAVSKHIKFKFDDDKEFAGWELRGWRPGEMPYPDHAGGSPERDMREWAESPDMDREMAVDTAMKLMGWAA